VDQKQASPQGIGMAVAIDWGLATQMILTPIISAISNPSHQPPLLNNILTFVVSFIIGGILIFFGEQVRRGRNWSRIVQFVANLLLSIFGLYSLIHLYQSIQVGNFWPIITEIILIIISPLIVWRMSRPSTIQWFKTVSVAEARRRHGGKWVWFIALWSIVGGILQITAAMMK
jgi:hypothetical protein